MYHKTPFSPLGLALILILLVGLTVSGCDLLSGKQTDPYTPTAPTASVPVSGEIQPELSKEDPNLTGEPEVKGDPDWWKKQPDVRQENTAILAVKKDFQDALTSKNIEKAVSYFSPDVREEYSKIFALSPDLMPHMATDMANAKLSFLSLDTDFTLSRIAEYAFEVEGNTFRIVFIKIDGNWMLESY
jgi:hypothetical protein